MKPYLPETTEMSELGFSEIAVILPRSRAHRPTRAWQHHTGKRRLYFPADSMLLRYEAFTNGQWQCVQTLPVPQTAAQLEAQLRQVWPTLLA